MPLHVHLSECLSMYMPLHVHLSEPKVNTETEQSELSIVVDRVIKLSGILEKGLRVPIKAKVLQ